MNYKELLSFFLKNYPDLVKAMKDCDHGQKNKLNPYHEEGDVFTHTMMVMNEAEKTQNPILLLIALLHDIGKPDVRNEVGEKTTFYNHESVSAFLALDILEKLKINPIDRSLIFKAICLHTDSFRLTAEQRRDKYKSYSLDKTITEFGKCDHEGRITSIPSDLDDRVLECTENRIDFDNKRCIILTGLPYSGKSTFVSNLLKRHPTYYVVSRDNIVMELGKYDSYNKNFKTVDQNQVDKILQERFKEAKKHENIIVDMTHMSTKSRRKTMSHFDKSKTNFESITFLPTLEEIDKRHQIRVDKTIPDQVLFNMIKRFSPPLRGEGFVSCHYVFENGE